MFGQFSAELTKEVLERRLKIRYCPPPAASRYRPYKPRRAGTALQGTPSREKFPVGNSL